MKRQRIDVRCSFCGKTKDKVAKLIAGPGVFICDECVDLCNEILNEPPAPRTQLMPPVAEWVSTTRSKTSWWRRLLRLEAYGPA